MAFPIHPGHLIEHIHARGGGIHLLAAALRHLPADVVVYLRHRVRLLSVQEGQRLRALVGKLLLHHERGGYLVPLIEIAVHDKAVQLRPQGDGFLQRRHHDVEHGVGKVLLLLVLPGQIRVHGGQIHLTEMYASLSHRFG